MFDALRRHLPYPLDRASNLEVIVPEDDGVCGLPEFPEDSDEKMTVLFRLSLNEFVALATSIDVGSDIAYGDDGLKVWYLWVASIMCAQFCEEMAECLTTENPAVVAALASLITNNQTIINAISSSITNAGSAVPGQPLTPEQGESDTLPENVRDGEGDCVLDALWGACLFLVQSGNRAITDFFEQIEAASNTLETSAIVSQTIPAAGAYVSAAVEFADQLQENLAEGYAGAYTETYENELACALFCMARENCELTPDMLMTVMAERLGYVDGTENFGTVMARIGVGVFVGSQIADSAFYIYFTALRFGQQFGDILGFRPLTDLMSLGADQLNSNNWETLCDCPEEWSSIIDFTASDGGFTPLLGTWVDGVGWVGAYSGAGAPSYRGIAIQLPFSVETTINYANSVFDYSAGTLDASGDSTYYLAGEAGVLQNIVSPVQPVSPQEWTGVAVTDEIALLQVLSGILLAGGDPGGTVVLTGLELHGTGTKPPELP